MSPSPAAPRYTCWSFSFEGASKGASDRFQPFSRSLGKGYGKKGQSGKRRETTNSSMFCAAAIRKHCCRIFQSLSTRARLDLHFSIIPFCIKLKPAGNMPAGFQSVEKPERAREGRSPFELSIVPSGVYGGHGTIFAAENSIFQSKNRFPAVFALGNPKDFSKNWRGWQWRGSVLPRPQGLSKALF